MKKTARAFAPGNISLLFKVLPNDDPAAKTALGSGFTVNEGVTVEITSAPSTSIFYNGQPIDLAPVLHVIRQMTSQSVHVAIISGLPLGSGFGISGAASLAAAHALNALLDAKKTPLMLVKIAHLAEVVSDTGLGDVGNEWKGGCCVKFASYALFEMQRLPFAGTTVYVRSWGKIPTPTILSNTKLLERIDRAGDTALRLLQTRVNDSSFSFAELLTISNVFTKESGLIDFAPHARECIRSIHDKGGHAAMIILGDAVVSDTQFEGATKLIISERGVAMV